MITVALYSDNRFFKNSLIYQDCEGVCDTPADRLSIRHTHTVGMTDCFSKDTTVGLHLHVPLPQAPLSTFLRCVCPLPLFPSIHGLPSYIFCKCSSLLHGPRLS
jgi:hypothetical protein